MKTLLVAGAAVLLAAAPAFAQYGQYGSPAPQTMPDRPRSESGSMTRSDAERRARAQFRSRDANHDRFVTADEFGASGAALLSRFDADHDGKLSRDEMTAAVLAEFDAADTDHDRRLSAEERQAMMQPRSH
jgi:hypothetical protein